MSVGHISNPKATGIMARGILLFFSLIWLSDTATAQTARDIQLGHGLEILSTFKDSNPQTTTLYEKLKDRMPAGVKTGKGQSGWLKNQAVGSRQELKQKLKDKKIALIRGGDGKIYAIGRKDMADLLQTSVEHALSQPDFDKIYGDALNRMSPRDKARLSEKLGGLANILKSPGTLRTVVKGANIASIWTNSTTPAGDLAMGLLEPELDKFRDKLRQDIETGKPISGIGPPVSADARPDKSPSRPEEGRTDERSGTTGAAGSEVETPDAKSADNQDQDNGKAARQAAVIARLDSGFSILDKAISQLEAAFRSDQALCRKASDAVAPGGEIDRISNASRQQLEQFTRSQRIDMIDQIPVLKQLEEILRVIRSNNKASEDATALACKPGTDAVATASLSKHQALRSRNHAALANQLKNTARIIAAPMITRLSAPVKLPSVAEFDARRREIYQPLKNYCTSLAQELKPLQDKISNSGSLSDYWQKRNGTYKAAEMIIGLSRQALRDLGEDLDATNKFLYRTRLAGYRSRMQRVIQQAGQCSKKPYTATATCIGAFNLVEEGYRDTRDFSSARQKIIQDRKTKLAQIRSALKEIEAKAQRVSNNADRAKACFRQAETKADTQQQINRNKDRELIQQAQAALGSCDARRLYGAAGSLANAKSRQASDVRRRLGDRARIIGRIDRLITQATKAGQRKNINEARARLAQASTSLAALGGGGACGSLQTRIKAARAALVDQAREVVAACTKAQGGINNALQQYHRGNTSTANRLLQSARQELANVPKGQCGNLHDRVNTGLQRVAEVRAAETAVNVAINSCNEKEISRLESKFMASPYKAKGPILARLDDAAQKCSRTRRRNEARRARDNANRECVQLNGKGFYAGQKLANGSYYCLPNKKTANAWCRANNGRGSFAGRINANGSYKCYRSRSANRQQAWAACRRRFPNSLVDVKVYRSGRYQCITRTVRRQPPPRFRPQPQPQHRTSDSAAVIGGILGAFGQLQQGRRQRTRNRPQIRRPTARVRRRPTTRCPNGRFNNGSCRGGLGVMSSGRVITDPDRLRRLRNSSRIRRRR